MTPNPNPSPELRELIDILEAATEDDGLTVYEHSAAEIGLAVMDCRPELLVALSAQTQSVPAMKSWSGGERAPDDWDGKTAMDRRGIIGSYHRKSEAWQRRTGELPDDIVAYAVKEPALSPQTLPAPGEVDHIADAGNMVEVECIRRAIWGYVNAQPEDAAMLPLVQFLANRDVFLAEAIAPATVAAANDEGFARGIEAAAKVADGIASGKMTKSDECCASDDPIDVEYSVAFHRQGSTAQQIAAAIRLLSQGGGE